MPPELRHGYELVDVIGEGGMGRVYRAIELRTGRQVAVKTLRRELRDDAARRRLLLDEATAAARLHDPRFVELIDVGSDADGAPYLVLELVVGHDLDVWVASWPGIERVASVLDDVLGGLIEAHAAGIVHRDLKPSNVLVTPDGRAKIADFGIARMLDPLGAADERGIYGTPEYMAPEQIQPSTPVGPWTDLYALGAMVFQLVTGGLPFEGHLAMLTVGKLLGPAPAAVPRRGLELPPDGIELIRALLEREPRRRPRFARDVRATLAGVAARTIDRVQAKPPHESADSTAQTVASSPAPSIASAETLDTRPRAETSRSARPPSTVRELPMVLEPTRDAVPGASLMRLREVPIVAREAERAELSTLIDEVAADGRARAVALIGAAGVGKSRLARWGLAEVERRGVMEGVAVGYDASGASLAGGLRNALRRVLGVPPDPAESWRWLDDGRVDLDALAKWVTAGTDARELAFEQTLVTVHDALRALGRVRPVYLWLDDGGWSSDGALEVVTRLLDDPDARVLTVVTMRAGTADHPRARDWLVALGEHPRGRALRVEPFGHAERVRLLESTASFAPGVAAQIAPAVDGTPLQMLHLVRSWTEAGLLEATSAGLAPSGGRDVARMLIERPLAALVRERIETLLTAMGDRAAAAERVLSRAALLGLRFEDAALRSACEGDPESVRHVDAVLDNALLLGILRFESEGVYELEHAVLQEHLLERLAARPEASEILRGTVAAIGARYGRARADVGARAAALLWQAGERDEAWTLVHKSIAGMARASAIGAATEQLAVATRWLDEVAEPAISRRRFDLCSTEATILYWALRYDDALEAIARARAIADGLADDAARARCTMREATIRFYRLELARARELATEIAALMADPNLDPDRAAAGVTGLDLLANIAALEGDLDLAAAWNRKHVALKPRLSPWHSAFATLCTIQIDFARGEVDRAATAQAALVAAARQAGDVDLVSDLRCMSAILALATGRFEEAQLVLADACRDTVAAGDHWGLTSIRVVEASLAVEVGEPAARTAAVRRFLDAFDRVPSDVIPTVVLMRALVGRLEAAGEPDLAAEVRARRQARDRAYEVGFGRA